MTENVERSDSFRDAVQNFLENSIVALFAIGLALGLTLILSFNLISRQEVNVTLGQPSSVEVIAPQSKTYTSEVLTQQARDRAAASVANVYTSPDLSIARAQTDRAEAIFNFVDAVRADSITDSLTKVAYLKSIVGITVEDQTAMDLLALTAAEYDAVKRDVLRIVEEVMRGEIREEALGDARRQARQLVSFSLSAIEEAVVTSLAPQFIVANTFFDEAATAQRRAEAIAAVEPIKRSITKDEQILRVGEVVDTADIEALQELNLIQRQTSWRDVGAVFIASIVVSAMLALYWQQFHARMQDANRYLLILSLLILLFTLTAKLMLPVAGTIAPYLVPMAALSMLLAVTIDQRLAIYVTLLLASLIAFGVGSSLEMTIYMSAGGIMAVLLLQDAQRINAFFRAGLMAALGNVAVILFFRLPDPINAVEFVQLLMLGVTNGLVFSAGLTLVGLFIVGSLFRVVTVLQLQELSRLDHPMLKDLLRRAPGTYHHSIMVANLAEQAAESIKANSALVRVGSFYHDIGKVNRPPFFTENQEGINPHDTLDPYSSARIILAHVSDGLELARRHRLPKQVQDFIATHHGDRLIRAFYVKALERAGNDPEKVDLVRFKHKGPRPRSRETGLVLLADAIEAVSSALRPNTEEAIEKLVNSIVDEDLRSGQLDDSGLTLDDIKALRVSFIETLKGRFHLRVKYPGNEELEGTIEPVREGAADSEMAPLPRAARSAAAAAANPAGATTSPARPAQVNQ